VIDALAQSFYWLQYVVLLVMGAALVGVERAWPRRPGQPETRARWVVNVGLYALGLLLLAVVVAPLQAAAIRIGSLPGWGGLGAAPLPDALKVALGVLLVDALQYGLHRLCHAVPLLWQLHQVHHSDEAFDVSTSVRHHPLEVLALTGLNLMLCAALGVPLLSLLVYALLLAPHSLFCHSNVAIPAGVDRVLRWFSVTPDMHRVHHSVRMDEGHRNFGMVFPWWDQLFRTYCAQPQDGSERMRLGLAQEHTLADGEAPRTPGLWASLWQPFARQPR